jgi:hypothetical protein
MDIYEGHVDGVDGLFVVGWAMNKVSPKKKAIVALTEGGVIIARALANQRRPDLAELGYSDWHLGFRIGIPEHLLDGKPHSLSVIISETEQKLLGVPLEIDFLFTKIDSDDPLTVEDLLSMDSTYDDVSEWLSELSAHDWEGVMDKAGVEPMVILAYMISLGRKPDLDGFRNSLTIIEGENGSWMELVTNQATSSEFSNKKRIKYLINPHKIFEWSEKIMMV